MRAFVRWVLPLFVLVFIGSVTGWSGLFRDVVLRGRATAFDYLCFAMLGAMFIRGSVWIFREGGAEFVAERRLLNTLTNTEGEVKIWWMLLVAGATAGWIGALLGLGH